MEAGTCPEPPFLHSEGWDALGQSWVHFLSVTLARHLSPDFYSRHGAASGATGRVTRELAREPTEGGSQASLEDSLGETTASAVLGGSCIPNAKCHLARSFCSALLCGRPSVGPVLRQLPATAHILVLGAHSIAQDGPAHLLPLAPAGNSFPGPLVAVVTVPGPLSAALGQASPDTFHLTSHTLSRALRVTGHSPG